MGGWGGEGSPIGPGGLQGEGRAGGMGCEGPQASSVGSKVEGALESDGWVQSLLALGSQVRHLA